jgi:hypothetical protein
MIALVDCLDCLLCMYGSYASNYHSIQLFVEHLVIVSIDLHPLEMFGRPFAFLLIRCTRSNYMRTGCQLVKIHGVTLAC